MILLFAENKGYFSQLRQLAERLPKDEVVLADRGTAWATPLYIAFDRKVTPIDWEREKGNNTFNGWIAKQIGEQKPVYLLREARLRLLGLQKIKADEVILSRTYSEPTLEPLPKKILSEQKTIRLYKITGVIKRSDYRNIALGAEMVWGVEESGFYDQEWRDNRPVRWTNGAARLVVPLDEQRAPGALRVDLESTGPKGTTLQVRVNGNTLLNGEIPSGGWSRTFRLPSLSMEGPMTIELLSGTFVPRQAVQGSLDQRTLGVAVQGIRLLEGVQPLPARLLSNEGYRSQLSLAENRENFHVAPGQTIPLKVIVRNIGKDAWPTFADLGVQKGTVNLGILWFARGQVDKRLAEQRSELPHRVFSNDEVEIDVILNPVDYNGRRLPPGIYEAWIELVQEHVAWFHDKGGAVLKLTVEVKS